MWDHRSYYVLSEVYWRMGHAMFGGTWTGYENTYRPSVELPEIRLQHRNAQRAVEYHLEHSRVLHGHFSNNMTDEAYGKLRAEIKAAEAASADARLERDQLSATIRAPEENQACFDRNIAVQKRLVRAFSHDELVLTFGTGQNVKWDKWANHSSFRVNFAQSLIYAPSGLSGIRRATGFVDRKKFDTWLSDIYVTEATLAKREGPEKFVKMRDWFLDWIQNNPKKPKKENVKLLFESAFSPEGKTTFSDLWKAFAPESWQKGGRHKK